MQKLHWSKIVLQIIAFSNMSTILNLRKVAQHCIIHSYLIISLFIRNKFKFLVQFIYYKYNIVITTLWILNMKAFQIDAYVWLIKMIIMKERKHSARNLLKLQCFNLPRDITVCFIKSPFICNIFWRKMEFTTYPNTFNKLSYLTHVYDRLSNVSY